MMMMMMIDMIILFNFYIIYLFNFYIIYLFNSYMYDDLRSYERCSFFIHVIFFPTAMIFSSSLQNFLFFPKKIDKEL